MAGVLRLKFDRSIIFPANCTDYDDCGRRGLNALPHFVHGVSGPCGTVADHAFDRGADLGLDRHHEPAPADLGLHLHASAQPSDRLHHLHRVVGVGVLTWAWIAIMSPHRLTWDFTYTLQLNLAIVFITFIAWVVAREPKRIPMNAATVMILLFMAWMTLTTATSLAPVNSWFHWDLHIKSLIFALAVMAIMRTQVRIQALIWITVMSIGYFGVKGGGFTIVHGGAYTVLGPPESIIEDRNHLALACCMIIPLMNYLRVTSANRFIRIGLMLAMALTIIISVIGSYSRGGFLALSVTAF